MKSMPFAISAILRSPLPKCSSSSRVMARALTVGRNQKPEPK